MFPTFSQHVTLQEVFETAAQINEELKRTEFDGAFCKRFTEFLGNGFSLFFAARRKSVELENDPLI